MSKTSCKILPVIIGIIFILAIIFFFDIYSSQIGFRVQADERSVSDIHERGRLKNEMPEIKFGKSITNLKSKFSKSDKLACSVSSILDTNVFNQTTEFTLNKEKNILTYKKENYPIKMVNITENLFDIKIKKKKNLLGLRSFYLLEISALYTEDDIYSTLAILSTNVFYKMLINELAKKEELTYLRTNLVKLKHRHKLSLCVLQEDIDKLMLENNNKREGIIFKNYYPLKVLQDKKSPKTEKQKLLLEKLHTNFLTGKIAAYKIFDIKKFTKYHNIMEKLANQYNDFLSYINPHEFYLYFNPITGLIEPIGFSIVESKETPKNIIDIFSNITPKDLKRKKDSSLIPGWFDIKEINPYFKKDFKGFEFIKEISRKNIIKIKSGTWNIANDLIIPQNNIVIADKGTKLNLINNAKIISFSPIRFKGNQDSPIIIDSKDSSGGILILNTDKKSLLQHVTFKNLANPKISGWEQKGAITFYESDVDIKNCNFIGNKNGDDYLNIFGSNFSIIDSKFQNTFADAFDADFSKGIIKNTIFQAIRNDAIDTSASDIKISNIIINKAADKAISIGERSNIKLKNITIENSNIGIAGKDLSIVKAKNIKIINCEIGVTAFQKKAEHGPAKIYLEKLITKNLSTDYLLEKDSELFINKHKQKVNAKKLRKKLY